VELLKKRVEIGLACVKHDSMNAGLKYIRLSRKINASAPTCPSDIAAKHNTVFANSAIQQIKLENVALTIYCHLSPPDSTPLLT